MSTISTTGTALLDLSPAGTSTMTLSVAGDTSNFMNGLDLAPYATVSVHVAVASVTVAPVVDKAIALPTPTMVNGRPT